MLTLFSLRKELKAKANSKRAKSSQRFFKTGKGEYGEGDIFLGVSVPEIRKIAKRHKDLNLKEIGQLLKSKIHPHTKRGLAPLAQENNYPRYGVGVHEERQTALLILVDKFQSLNNSMELFNEQKIKERREIFNFYLKNTKYINNWDLVDLSAPKIVGEYLLDKSKTIRYKLLRQLAESKNLWERRIAVLTTYAFIKKNKFIEILKISEMLLNDKHDLIQKAVGWMLREVGKPRNVHRDALRGKRSQKTLEKFLKKHASKMPRVMLIYAIEKFPETRRRYSVNR